MPGRRVTKSAVAEEPRLWATRLDGTEIVLRLDGDYRRETRVEDASGSTIRNLTSSTWA